MSKAYQIKVGDMTCASLQEGGGPMPGDMSGRYPNATADEIANALDNNNVSVGSLNPLYIDTGDTKILADVGFGEARRPEMGNVEPALASIGVSAEDIDIVYLTHFHGDHIIGLLTPDGQPAFPNARYITTQAEWDEWIPRWEASDQEGHQQQLAMVKSLEGQFTFVDDGDEIASGVTVVMLAGHTLGHSGLLVESSGERLIHVADVLHNVSQFRFTHWQFRFDSDGDLGVKTRESILQRCVDENLLTVFYHLPFPGVGHVAKNDEGYVWQPVDAS